MTHSFFYILALFLVLSCGKHSPVEPTEVSRMQSLVTFSFDDGWRSTYENAFPVLEQAGFRSTSYIITSRFSNPLYVGGQEVLDLERRGHEIGSHSRSHVDLTAMPLDEAEREVWSSREDLFKLGVKSVMSFSYPFGASNEAVIDAVRRAGYSSARGIRRGLNKSSTNRYSLQIQNLGGPITLPQVASWVDESIRTNTWIIFMIHHVDSTISDFSITPNLFREIVNYVRSKKIPVVTVSEGIELVP